MINRFRSKLTNHYINIKGFRTNRKIIVIESDDWGSIRMPSLEVKEKFEAKHKMGDDPYQNFDAIASSADLEALFDVLRKFKNKDNQTPIITFNIVMSNPDFNKIKASGFTKYTSVPFTETLKEYYPNENVFSLWEQGFSDKLIHPQFHGREHVNIPVWFDFLRNGHQAFLDAFDLGFWGIPRELYTINTLYIEASFGSNKEENIQKYHDYLKEGLKSFKTTFGFDSKTFIPNNYTLPLQLMPTLKENGIEGLQGMHYIYVPEENFNLGLHEVYIGKKSKEGIVHTLRNCHFEPTQQSDGFDNVNECLRQIKTAFFWKKPAIISSHRLNFIGSISEKNRIQNLQQLNTLLGKILQKWPDVEFMTSDELIEIMKRKASLN